MEERSSQLVVVVGASSRADRIRRRFLRLGRPTVGITTHLQGLRELLVRGEFDHVIICLCFDRPTIERHSQSVSRLIDDRVGFQSDLSVVGLLSNSCWSRAVVGTGCDVLASSVPHAMRLMRSVARNRRIQSQRRRLQTEPTAPLGQNRMFGKPLSEEISEVFESIANDRSCANTAQKNGV